MRAVPAGSGVKRLDEMQPKNYVRIINIKTISSRHQYEILFISFCTGRLEGFLVHSALALAPVSSRTGSVLMPHWAKRWLEP
jgi:hypothetical protein